MGYVWDFSLVASNHSTRKSLERLRLKRLEGALHVFNKLTSVFHASVLLLIMNFVITLSK